MADEKPIPFWWPTLEKIIIALATALISILVSRYGFPPAPVIQKVEIPVPIPFFGEPGQAMIATADRTRPTEGWVKDPIAIAANRNPLVTTQFSDTPAGKASLGDEDVFMWRYARKAAGKGDDWLFNIDQRQVGCCVGCGWKHAADFCQAAQIVSGAALEFKPVSAEGIYGYSRVEVGGGRIRGDGSVGSWAADAVKKGGLLPMEQLDGVDLTVFSPARAREWGRTGMPDNLEPLAKMHPVKNTALVRSWSDVKKAIQQGFPVAVCSDQGFTMTRDSTGTCRPSGSWAHCMCICGVRTKNGKQQGFILNSWGNSAHTGPVDPPDAPVAGFWADSNVIDDMVGQGDSFALSELAGFPARRVPIDWFSRAEPRKSAQPLFAVRPEAVLAW